jgi:AraC-like DNA-binding protein
VFPFSAFPISAFPISAFQHFSFSAFPHFPLDATAALAHNGGTMRRSISPLVHQFDDSLWTDSPYGGRSAECSPLYIDRYAGWRKSAAPGMYSCWELTAMISGSTRLTTGKTTVTERQDELLLLAPHTRHSEAGEMADTIWLGFTGERVAAATRGLKPVTIVRSHALTQSVERLWLFARQQGRAIGPELDAWTAQILAEFVRLARPSAGAAHVAAGWVEEAIQRIESHLDAAEPLRVSDLARQFGCSEGHFCRVIRARTGHPPVTYILRARIKKSLHLLQNTDWPVSEVARAVGLANPFYFSRVFHRITGKNPSDCRKR